MMDDDLTIGLYGIYGVYNYGCEAIVRGTEIILREKWPDINIKYASLRPEDDKKRLKGCGVEVVPRVKKSLLSPGGAMNVLAHTTGLPFYPPYMEETGWLDSCDAVFSIGGDLYTLPSNYQDGSRFHFLNYLHKSPAINYGPKLMGKPYHPLLHFGDLVQEKNKKFIIWGASIGPFERSENAKMLFKNHFLHLDLITAREAVTRSYLTRLGITSNVEDCADPAFLVSTSTSEKDSEQLRIGINLSPLSLSQVHGEREKMVSQQAELIKRLVETFQAEIVLIPHVISDNIIDDDLRYLKSLKSLIDEDVTEYVSVIDNDPGFLGVKEVLASCDMVISARMHCAINALEQGVPTIFVAYSKKAEGMARYVYGDNQWLISLENMETRALVDKVSALLKQKDQIRDYLQNKKETYTSDALKPLSRLEDILKG